MNDLVRSAECLKPINPGETPMDTGAKRYWWGSRAKLALAKGDARTALEISDGVIDYMESMMPGSSHSGFWRLRAAALVAVGRPKEAESMLLAARDHAQGIGELSQLWRIQSDLAQLYGGMKRNSEADSARSAARLLIDELAATIPDEELRDTFFERAVERVAPTSVRPACLT